MYARPTVNGTATTLGVSGMLWRDALIMYDRATRSLWSQVNGRAVAGKMTGQRLREIPSSLTTWREWKRRHPKTLVLTKPPLRGSPYQSYFADPQMIGVRGSKNRDRRLPGKELVFGLEREERTAVVRLRDVERRQVLNAEGLGIPLVITTAGTYQRRVEDRTLTFEPIDGTTMRDRETESRWSTERGTALDGRMKGTKLERVTSRLVYWGVWSRFHANSEVVRIPSP